MKIKGDKFYFFVSLQPSFRSNKINLKAAEHLCFIKAKTI